MAAMDLLIQNAFKLLLAQMPPEAPEQLATVLRSGVELKGQLDRIEADIAALKTGVGEIRTLLVSLVGALQQRQGNSHEQPSPGPGEPARTVGG